MFIFLIIIFSCSHCGTKYLLVDTRDTEDKGQDYAYQPSTLQPVAAGLGSAKDGFGRAFGLPGGLGGGGLYPPPSPPGLGGPLLPPKSSGVGTMEGPAVVGLPAGPAGVEYQGNSKGEDYVSDQGRTIVQDSSLDSATNVFLGQPAGLPGGLPLGLGGPGAPVGVGGGTETPGFGSNPPCNTPKVSGIPQFKVWG